ncbi:hypothetical protein COF07_00015 [Bacillus wiedmannii]|nr:hypothetical protein CON83_02195 [Bacillus wiedmannii]PEJ45644.1 hypothetical protein CN889_01275 [Bacillus wiedmannii]PEO17611.1 hypothetical protein CN546_13045 [Bacillus wiedmannii]PEU24879.1 hypothetical protein CN532_19950 [Bacillus wiedmannii]PGB43757.1 hypothetical protein COM01_18305 [Bacillus wiedmannii]
MIPLKKFSISYLICLLVFSIIVNVLQYTLVPNYADSHSPRFSFHIYYSLFSHKKIALYAKT